MRTQAKEETLIEYHGGLALQEHTESCVATLPHRPRVMCLFVLVCCLACPVAAQPSASFLLDR